MTTKNFRVRRGLTIAGDTTGSTSLAATNTGTDQSYTLPAALPTSNGYVLASQTDGTMSWVDNSAAGTTYDFNATSASGGANLNLVGSDATTDTVKLTNAGHITATYTSGTEVTLGSDATDANTASTIVARDASGDFSAGSITLAGDIAVNGGDITTNVSTTANIFNSNAMTTLNIGGDALNVNIGRSSGAVIANNDLSVTRNLIFFGSTNGYSTFTQPATGSNNAYILPSASGAASTVLTNDGSGVLSWALPGGGGSTFGNITVGVDTDNTISTTTGDLVLDSATNLVVVGTGASLQFTDVNGIIKSSTGQTAITVVGNDVTTADFLTSGGNFKSNFGASITDTLSAGGKQVDSGGDVLVANSTLNTTQLPVAGFFDNTSANRNGRIVIREYGLNTGNLATATTVGAGIINLEGSRGTGTAPVAIGAPNNSVGIITGGYYDGTRWTSESGIGAPVGVFLQNSEAVASETSVFTASISGTTMTVTAVASGAIHVGQLITGTGVANGTSIIAYGNDTFGGAGTYTVSFSQTTASTTITGVGTTAGGGRIIQVIAPTGNKISNVSRQSMYVTAQAAPNTQVINGVTVPQNAQLNIINGNVEGADATYVNSAGNVVYKARGGGTFQIPTLTLNMAGVPFEDRCSFNGYIDNGAGGIGNTLTVTTVVSGVLYVGQRIYAVGLSNTTPYFITALGSGTGLTGTYTIASTFQTAGTLLGSGASPVAMAGTPDDLRLAGNGNNISVTTSRKSTVSNRRAPLRSGDGIFSFNIAGQTGALGTNTTANVGNFNWGASENFSTTAAGSSFQLRTCDIGTTNLNNRIFIDSGTGTITTNILNINNSSSGGGGSIAQLQSSTSSITTSQLNLNSPSGSTNGTSLNMSFGGGVGSNVQLNTNGATTGPTLQMNTGGTNLLQAGDVNIVQMGSTWQSAFTPGFKYNGLASSSTLTGNGTLFEMSPRWKANAATAVFDPPQNGWGIGTFAFSADNSTTGTSQISAGGVRMEASENWTSTATGTEVSFTANRAGVVNQGRKVIAAKPELVQISANVISFSEDATSTQLADFNVSRAQFRVPVTTEITTTTISEGTTYTPAATVDNNISVQINALAGGTTVIDLAGLTGNNRGASYNILVFNNTGSGAPLHVINSRISGSNLMAHTITTGSPRIIVNAYVVGDYATATHLNVA